MDTKPEPISMFTQKNPVPKLINAGCSAVLLRELREIKDLEIDYHMLFVHFQRIRSEQRERGLLVLPSHANTVWKLLCLTGQTPCISHALTLIKKDGQLDAAKISPEQQYCYNLIEAMNYTAYTANIEGLELLYNALPNKAIFKKNPHLSLFMVVNAVYSNELSAVKWIIENLKIDKSSLRSMKKNLLIYGAELGNVEMMEYAVKKCGISKKAVDSTRNLNALQIAVFSGKINAVKYAINKLKLNRNIFSNGHGLLHLAFESGHIPTIEYLLSLNMDTQVLTENGDNMLHCAAMAGHVEAMIHAVKLGITPAQNHTGATPLHYAANSGSLPAVQYALELGCALDSTVNDGLQAVHFAAASGNLEVFKHIALLLNPDTIKQLLNSDPRIIKDIIQHDMGVNGIEFAVLLGLDLKIQIDNLNSNLLIIAARQNNINNLSVFTHLINSGIKPEANAKNITILHMAALSGDPEMLKMAHEAVLSYDPDSDFLKNKGEQALLYAYASRSPNVNAMIATLDALLFRETNNEALKFAII